jgi:hypothetical protein
MSSLGRQDTPSRFSYDLECLGLDTFGRYPLGRQDRFCRSAPGEDTMTILAHLNASA